jgi:hypothetical protein
LKKFPIAIGPRRPFIFFRRNEKMKRVYEHEAAGQALNFRGGSWRLPENIAKQFVINPFIDLCRQYSVDAKPCKANLINTP